MVSRALKILDLIGEGSNDEQIEGLLEIAIDGASVDDINKVRDFFDQKLRTEPDIRIRSNYGKARELLD